MKKVAVPFLVILFFLFTFKDVGFALEKNSLKSLMSLLPAIPSWKLTEAPQDYFPEILFEYINGAAEVYLMYDFKELIVAQYERKNSDASLSVEIYDMGNEKNSFGIYSVERFPESNFISIGNGGYVEEGVFNFIVGKYYIKLLCFDCEEDSENFLRFFAQEIQNNVKDKKGLPELLKAFPKEGLVKNSEKYILRNFLGFGFFHNGYIADYKFDGLEFECFIIEAEDEGEAQVMLKKYLDHYSKEKKYIEESSLGYHLTDSFYMNIFLAKAKNYICGVVKIKNGAEKVGEKYLKSLTEALNKGFN